MLSRYGQTAICSGEHGCALSSHHTIAPTPALGQISTEQFEEMKRPLGLNVGETAIEDEHH